MKKASVLGIGRLGLCFALTLERGGYDVVGSDIREDHVKSVNDRTFDTCEPDVCKFLSEAKNFRATSSLKEAVEHSDMLFVTVRTGSDSSGVYNCTQVDKLVSDLQQIGKVDNKDLVVCCNVKPGYSDTVEQRLSPYGYKVSFNPEWVAQGTILRDQAYPDLVVIGQYDTESGDRIQKVYEDICLSDPVIHRMDRKSAEITKISLNCFLTAKLSFANMVGQIAIASGCEPAKILSAIGTDSRINPKYFKYGFGYGGPCFPRDNRAMVTYAEEIGIPPFISKAVIETNDRHLDFMVNHFVETHSKDENVVIESVTYKPGTVILEESQQLLYAERLAKAGFSVTIKEHPDVIEAVKETYGDLFTYEQR